MTCKKVLKRANELEILATNKIYELQHQLEYCKNVADFEKTMYDIKWWRGFRQAIFAIKKEIVEVDKNGRVKE